MAKRGNGEGSIYQRADGKWCASVSLEDGKRKVVYGKTRQEVAQKLTKILRDVHQGLPVQTDERLPVGQYLARWLEHAVKPRLRASTYESYERLIRLYIVPALGRHPLAKLTPQQVQAFLNQQASSGLSPRTVQYTHAVLRHALNRAVKWGLLGRNVATLVDPPRGERPKVVPLTVAQAGDLLAAARGHRLQHLITVVLATGLRMGEALALRTGDVDLEGAALTVRHALERIPRHARQSGDQDGWRLSEPKSERGHRVLPLIPAAVAALRAQRSLALQARLLAGSRWQEHGFVFPSAAGTPLNARNVFREYQELLTAAGIPHKRFHDLRHSTATYLLAAGVTERVVMEMLGHSQISLTMNTYAHVLPAVLGEAAARLDAMFPSDHGTQQAT